MKKILLKTSLTTFFLLMIQSCNIIKEEIPKTEVEKKFDSIQVETIDGKKTTLIDYLDSLKTTKPIVLFATNTNNKTTKKVINEILEYKKKNQDFEIVTLFTDQIDSLLYTSKIKDKTDLLKKVNDVKLIPNTIIDVKGNYVNRLISGNTNNIQAYIIKNDSLVFNNLGSSTTYYEKWGQLIVDALDSRNKIVENSIKFRNSNITQATYAFKDLKPIGSWETFTYDNKSNKKVPFNKRNFINGKLEGEYKQYHNNGNLEKVDIYKNGKLSGIRKIYYENGTVESYGQFTEGLAEGEWKHYYENGNLKESAIYKLGKINGIRKTYYENGNLEFKGNYVDNLPEGIFKFYHENAKLKRFGKYVNGKLDGEWKYYYENGNLKESAIYKIGKINGIRKTYHENGNLKYTGNYVDDLAEGLFKFYHENANLKSFGKYIQGKLEGEWKNYHDNKVLEQVGSYIKGKPYGEWRIYHKTKKLYQKRIWKNGRLMDILSCNNDKGAKLNKGTLINGNGTVKYYKPNGRLKETITYKDGINWNNANELNRFAWNYYENETDSNKLKLALKWSKRSVALSKTYSYLDTYAALLYKTNQPKLGFEIAKKAINQAIKEKVEYKSTLELLEKYSKK